MAFLRIVWTVFLFVSLFISLSLSYREEKEEREDLYQTLGVTRTADKDDIKKAYARLAKKWYPLNNFINCYDIIFLYYRHPDKNRSPEASEMMTKINKAYKVLINMLFRTHVLL